MTRASGDKPNIPPAARQKWAELNRAVRRRQAALDTVARETAKIKALIPELLADGVRRVDLEGHPYSQAMLTNIQKASGVYTQRRRTRPDRSDTPAE